MRRKLREAFEGELAQARDAEHSGRLDQTWKHLERAHVLSQADAGAHVRVHLAMLAFGCRRRDLREVVGQVARLFVAAPGSWLGRAPIGNTGGANVGMFKPMPIPDELQQILNADTISDEQGSSDPSRSRGPGV